MQSNINLISDLRGEGRLTYEDMIFFRILILGYIIIFHNSMILFWKT